MTLTSPSYFMTIKNFAHTFLCFIKWHFLSLQCLMVLTQFYAFCVSFQARNVSHCRHRSFHQNATTTTNERRNGRTTNKPTQDWATNSIESHQQSYSAWNWIYCHKIFAWLLLHDSPGDSNLNAKTDRTQHSLNSIKRPSKAIEDAIGRNSKQISTWNRMMQKANLNVSLLRKRERGSNKNNGLEW